ncbi:MAG: tetratricopeptide repeat protein [Methylotetracoccus sp.]|jgi:predicted negative regulator of RcsB-dependent stress response|nr:tetratricopeptide repeat protein [Methylotetracoccus sp.]
MEDYLTEEERLEALKRWLKENGRSVVLGVGFGAALVLGWNFWQTKQWQNAEQAGTTFQQMLTAQQNKQFDAALKLSERLIEQHGSSAYGWYGRLFAAKFKADRGELDAAKQLLKEVLAKSGEENLRLLARLRLAQVMLALQEDEEALQLIEAADTKMVAPYQALYAELKGDILLALGRHDQARTAYEQARSLGEKSPLLELKIQDLAPVRS